MYRIRHDMNLSIENSNGDLEFIQFFFRKSDKFITQNLS